MFAEVLRLLTLLALILMPFGMSAANAAPVSHQPAGAFVGHCDEHGSQPAETPPDSMADCATACSMLVTAGARIDEPNPTIREVIARPLSERSNGLHPDIATPPPKFS